MATSLEIGRLSDEIVDVCDGEGELFLYFSFTLFVLDLLLGLIFPFNDRKLSISISESHTTEVSDK